jgi:hypothetical protein
LPRFEKHLVLYAMVISVSRVFASAAYASAVGLPEVKIPKQSDWTLVGKVLERGPSKSWDARLHGQISPCSVVKKDGIYYLYYIGADGNREDGGPAHRALGVAVSANAVSFKKHRGNPILTYLPHNNTEEGVFSAGATLDANGDIVLYWTAILARNSTTTQVNSNIHVAISQNGVDFEKRRSVLRFSDPKVPSNDEIGALGAFHAKGRWHLYYFSKGGVPAWSLVHASGPARDNFPQKGKIVLEADKESQQVIGGGDPVWLSDNELAVFLVCGFDRERIEIRTISLDSPGELSSPVETYRFDGWRHATVFLDREKGKWFLYHRKREGDAIFVRTAPVVLSNHATKRGEEKE